MFSELLIYTKTPFPIITGFIFLGIYLLKNWNNSLLEDGLKSFGSGYGGAAGITVILFSFNKSYDKIDQIYIVIGGIVASWFCISQFYKIMEK